VGPGEGVPHQARGGGVAVPGDRGQVRFDDGVADEADRAEQSEERTQSTGPLTPTAWSTAAAASAQSCSVYRWPGSPVDAGVDVFARRGARGMTMTEVADLADVATATVTNHFATPESLLQAIVEHVLAEIEIPDRSIFAGARSAPTRLRALTAAMFAFYERSNR